MQSYCLCELIININIITMYKYTLCRRYFSHSNIIQLVTMLYKHFAQIANKFQRRVTCDSSCDMHIYKIVHVVKGSSTPPLILLHYISNGLYI